MEFFSHSELVEINSAVHMHAAEFSNVYERAAVWLGNIVEQVSLTVLDESHDIASYLEDFVSCR